MSRTYRFNKGKDKYRVKDSWLLNSWERQTFDGVHEWTQWVDVSIDPKSDEGKRRLARFHSDRKYHVVVWNGPGWFNRLFSQKPHRTRAKKELHKFVRNPDHEVIIEGKPPRQYWW